MGKDYPDGPLDNDRLNHFNDNSMTRQQFREHHCWKQQQRIEEGILDQDNFAKIKMLLLQNCKHITLKAGLPDADKFSCKNQKCAEGWFDEKPQPSANIYCLEYINFNA